MKTEHLTLTRAVAAAPLTTTALGADESFPSPRGLDQFPWLLQTAVPSSRGKALAASPVRKALGLH